jgi:uncharacterized membrane protein YqhA
VERGVEQLLWGSRLIVVVGVLVTLLLALCALVLATLDAAYLAGLLGRYAVGGLDGAARDGLRTDVVTTIVKALDGYLIAALLIIVALGLYELFVSRLDPADASPARRLLQIRDLEDLKQRVAKLVVLVLAIEFFQQALRLPIASALELLYLAAGVVLISGALYLSGRHEAPPERPDAAGHPRSPG